MSDVEIKLEDMSTVVVVEDHGVDCSAAIDEGIDETIEVVLNGDDSQTNTGVEEVEDNCIKTEVSDDNADKRSTDPLSDNSIVSLPSPGKVVNTRRDAWLYSSSDSDKENIDPKKRLVSMLKRPVKDDYVGGMPGLLVDSPVRVVEECKFVLLSSPAFFKHNM